MSNKITVKKPFFIAFDKGDELELAENGMYAAETTDGDLTAKVYLSKEYVDGLKAQGDLADKFVNIFDEIDSLIEKYEKDYENANPFDITKKTALVNMIKVLTHLKNLKK